MFAELIRELQARNESLEHSPDRESPCSVNPSRAKQWERVNPRWFVCQDSFDNSFRFLGFFIFSTWERRERGPFSSRALRLAASALIGTQSASALAGGLTRESDSCRSVPSGLGLPGGGPPVRQAREPAGDKSSQALPFGANFRSLSEAAPHPQ
jgi:hypothetical protein